MSSKDKTVKDKVLAMVGRLGDDVTYDRIIYHVEVMKAVEQAIEEADQGMLIDDKDIWAEMEALDAADQRQVDENGTSRSARRAPVHRPAGSAKKRPKIRAKNSGRGKNA